MAAEQNGSAPNGKTGPKKRKETLEEQRARMHKLVISNGDKGAKVVQEWLRKIKGFYR